jgi:flagellar hook-length control protein FliK
MAFAAAMAEASGDVSLSDDPALLSGTSALEGGGRGDALAQANAQLSQAARGGQNPAPHMAALATGHLAAEVARFAGKGQTRFQIRMDPPELGRVDVELKFSKDGKVKAHLTVDRSETLDMFMRDQRGLERALDAAGLKLDPGSVELSLRDQGAGSFAQQQGMADGSGQDGNGTSGGPAHGGEAGETDREAVSFSRVQVAGSTGSLDIHI